MAITHEEWSDLLAAYWDAHWDKGTHSKTVVRAAWDAVNDLWDSQAKVALNNAIEGAAPGEFTGPEKIALVEYWLARKARTLLPGRF